MTHMLHLVKGMFQELLKDRKCETSKALTNTYPNSLGRIHGWFVQASVKVALNAAPYRADFLKSIEMSEDTLSERGPAFCAQMETIYAAIEKMFTAEQIPWIF